MGITTADRNIIAQLSQKQPQLSVEQLDCVLGKVETIITNIALPVFKRFDAPSQSLEKRVKELDTLRPTLLNAIAKLELDVTSLMDIELATESSMQKERIDISLLKIQKDTLTAEAKRIRELIDNGRTKWAKHKWKFFVGLGVVVVGGVTAATVYLAAKGILLIGIPKMTFVGGASVKSAGLLTTHAVVPTGSIVSGASAGTATAAAHALALRTIRSVEGQTQELNREASVQFTTRDAEKLAKDLDAAKDEVQAKLDLYYPTLQGETLSFKRLKRKEFTHTLNTVCEKSSARTIMAALYHTSFREPVDQTIFEIYTDMLKGTFEELEARVKKSIQNLEKHAGKKLTNAFKATKLSNKGTCFLISALKLRWIFNKMEQFKNRVASLPQLSSDIAEKERDYALLESKKKFRVNLKMEQEKKNQTQANEYAQLLKDKEKLAAEIATLESSLQDLNNEATITNTIITQNVG